MGLFKELGMKRDDFGRMVLESKLLFRFGLGEFLQNCKKMDLPLFVVSAGIGEIIEASFYAILHNGEIDKHGGDELREFYHNNVKILSNTFIYDENIGIDYCRPLVHILNKQTFIYDGENAKERLFKKNVIIMGDILEDVKMVRTSMHEVQLKIGFMNDLVS